MIGLNLSVIIFLQGNLEMSEIKLSPQLFDDVQQAVIQHDAEAAKDVGLLLQYLAAVTGYLLGSQEFERAHKDAFLKELGGFTQHVMDDTDKKMQPPSPPPAGNAMGYWEPPAKG